MSRKMYFYWILVSVVGFSQVSLGICEQAPPILNDWLKLALKNPSLETIQGRVEADHVEWMTRKMAAQEIVRLYFGRQTVQVSNAMTCLKESSLDGRFLGVLSQEFFNAALKILIDSKTPQIKKFGELVSSHKNRGLGIVLRPPSEGAPEKGGFHRSFRSVYLNLSTLTPSEWMITFIHEMTHAVDDQLHRSSVDFSNHQVTQLLSRCAREICEISPTEFDERLNAWLLAGLNRGLLAEVRAWTVTFAIYDLGRREGLWQDDVVWVRNTLEKRPHLLPLTNFVFALLDSRFPDPTEGIFSLSKIQSGLQSLRASLRNRPPRINGVLGEIVGD